MDMCLTDFTFSSKGTWRITGVNGSGLRYSGHEWSPFVIR